MLMLLSIGRQSSTRVRLSRSLQSGRMRPTAGVVLADIMSGICDLRAGRAATAIGRLGLVVAVVLLAAGELSGQLGSCSSALMMMLPALLLAAVMLVRPYPGERTIARLRTLRRAPEPRCGPVRPISPSGRPGRALVRGGRLIASALAGRAPPAVLARCR
jgi:hypothetical protein